MSAQMGVLCQPLQILACMTAEHLCSFAWLCQWQKLCPASMHSFAKKIMDNNVVSNKLKVSHSLASGGTFVVYIVHPMCSDGYKKIV